MVLSNCRLREHQARSSDNSCISLNPHRVYRCIFKILVSFSRSFSPLSDICLYVLCSVLQLHPAINFVLLFGALTLLAYCEALHYICVAVEKWDMSKYEAKYPRAVRCHKLIDTPEKVKKFLVGRQFFVIFVVFLIASITSFPYIPHDFAGISTNRLMVHPSLCPICGLRYHSDTSDTIHDAMFI